MYVIFAILLLLVIVIPYLAVRLGGTSFGLVAFALIATLVVVYKVRKKMKQEQSCGTPATSIHSIGNLALEDDFVEEPVAFDENKLFNSNRMIYCIVEEENNHFDDDMSVQSSIELSVC